MMVHDQIVRIFIFSTGYKHQQRTVRVLLLGSPLLDNRLSGRKSCLIAV